MYWEWRNNRVLFQVRSIIYIYETSFSFWISKTLFKVTPLFFFLSLFVLDMSFLSFLFSRKTTLVAAWWLVGRSSSSFARSNLCSRHLAFHFQLSACCCYCWDCHYLLVVAHPLSTPLFLFIYTSSPSAWPGCWVRHTYDFYERNHFSTCLYLNYNCLMHIAASAAPAVYSRFFPRHLDQVTLLKFEYPYHTWNIPIEWTPKLGSRARTRLSLLVFCIGDCSWFHSCWMNPLRGRKSNRETLGAIDRRVAQYRRAD